MSWGQEKGAGQGRAGGWGGGVWRTWGGPGEGRATQLGRLEGRAGPGATCAPSPGRSEVQRAAYRGSRPTPLMSLRERCPSLRAVISISHTGQTVCPVWGLEKTTPNHSASRFGFGRGGAPRGVAVCAGQGYHPWAQRTRGRAEEHSWTKYMAASTLGTGLPTGMATGSLPRRAPGGDPEGLPQDRMWPEKVRMRASPAPRDQIWARGHQRRGGRGGQGVRPGWPPRLWFCLDVLEQV